MRKGRRELLLGPVRAVSAGAAVLDIEVHDLETGVGLTTPDITESGTTVSRNTYQNAVISFRIRNTTGIADSFNVSVTGNYFTTETAETISVNNNSEVLVNTLNGNASAGSGRTGVMTITADGQSGSFVVNFEGAVEVD